MDRIYIFSFICALLLVSCSSRKDIVRWAPSDCADKDFSKMNLVEYKNLLSMYSISVPEGWNKKEIYEMDYSGAIFSDISHEEIFLVSVFAFIEKEPVDINRVFSADSLSAAENDKILNSSHIEIKGRTYKWISSLKKYKGISGENWEVKFYVRHEHKNMYCVYSITISKDIFDSKKVCQVYSLLYTLDFLPSPN